MTSYSAGDYTRPLGEVFPKALLSQLGASRRMLSWKAFRVVPQLLSQLMYLVRRACQVPSVWSALGKTSQRQAHLMLLSEAHVFPAHCPQLYGISQLNGDHI